MRIILLTILLTASITLGADWPQWRGPSQNGTSSETNLPATLDPNETQRWKTPLPGPGEGTPVVYAGHIYLSGYDKKSKWLFAMCFDAATGKQVWFNGVAEFDKLPNRNVIASPSPIADQAGVIFLYSNGLLLKYDHDGTRLWKRDLVAEHGPFSTGWSYSASGLLAENRLYIPVLRSPNLPRNSDYTGSMASYLLCIDPATGKDIFKVDRPTDAAGDFTDAYTTPVPAQINGQSQILLFGGNYLTGHDPATGKELWRYLYKDRDDRWGRAVASPIVDGNRVYCFYPTGIKAFACDLSKLAANETGRIWTYDQPISDVPTPVLVKGHLYMIVDGKKTLTCLNADTGAVQWTGQLDKSDAYYASITAADDKLYMVNRKGVVTIVAADPTAFRILSTRELGESPTDSTIAIANGKLYIRTAENLYCFGNK